jgi:hypothetical protein
MNLDIEKYNNSQNDSYQEICNQLAKQICVNLPEAENKIWHGHPVWFLDGNPVVCYSKVKNSIRLLFWSGQSFDEKMLKNQGSFKAAQIDYTLPQQINLNDLQKWLEKAKNIQWDYKNIVKRKGFLERLK